MDTHACVRRLNVPASCAEPPAASSTGRQQGSAAPGLSGRVSPWRCTTHRAEQHTREPCCFEGNVHHLSAGLSPQSNGSVRRSRRACCIACARAPSSSSLRLSTPADSTWPSCMGPARARPLHWCPPWTCCAHTPAQSAAGRDGRHTLNMRVTPVRSMASHAHGLAQPRVTGTQNRPCVRTEDGEELWRAAGGNSAERWPKRSAPDLLLHDCALLSCAAQRCRCRCQSGPRRPRRCMLRLAAAAAARAIAATPAGCFSSVRGALTGQASLAVRHTLGPSAAAARSQATQAAKAQGTPPSRFALALRVLTGVPRAPRLARTGGRVCGPLGRVPRACEGAAAVAAADAATRRSSAAAPASG